MGFPSRSQPADAGSAAYAFAETFHWRQGIDAKFTRARAFYAVVGVSIAIGVTMDFVEVSAELQKSAP